MTMYLSGGGSDDATEQTIARFVAEARERAERAPRVVLVAVADDANADRVASLVGAAGAETVVRVPSAVDGGEDEVRERLLVADAIVVAGDDVESILRLLEPAVIDVRRLVSEDVPYLGIGAGAAAAGDHAVLGGWHVDGVPVAPEASGAGRDEVDVATGLGLVDLAIDTGAAPTGALGRLLAVVESGTVDRGIAIDADTTLLVTNGALVVTGRGSVWQVQQDTESGTVILASVRGDA